MLPKFYHVRILSLVLYEHNITKSDLYSTNLMPPVEITSATCIWHHLALTQLKHKCSKRPIHQLMQCTYKTDRGSMIFFSPWRKRTASLHCYLHVVSRLSRACKQNQILYPGQDSIDKLMFIWWVKIYLIQCIMHTISNQEIISEK